MTGHKKHPQDNSKNSASFVLATLCTLPFAAGLVFYAIFLISRIEWFLDFIFLACMFWKLFTFMAAVGIISICVSWFKAPFSYKPFLIMYVLCILGGAYLSYQIIWNTGL